MGEAVPKHGHDHREDGPDPIEDYVKTKKVMVDHSATTTLVTYGDEDAYGKDGSEHADMFVRVIFSFMMADTDETDVRLSSSGSPEQGSSHFPEMGGAVLPYNPSGWFDCDHGDNLVLEIDGGGHVGGMIGWRYARP